MLLALALASLAPVDSPVSLTTAEGVGLKMTEDRPFIIMVDGAFVDLGVVDGPL